VKLFTSTESSETISFRMLHKDCGTPLKYQYWCAKDGKAVERDAILKGYEYAKDRYVVFTNEELKALEEEATKAIAIEEFVSLDQVDPIFFDKAYYLGPEKGGERAYRLLAKALNKKKLAGVARYAARGKQYLVVVRPLEKGLVMQQMHYANEVRAFSEVPIGGKDDVKDTELNLALQLIEQAISKAFDPSKYQDDVRTRVQEVIQGKIDGQEVTIAPAEEPKAQVIDLMEALKASLAGGGLKAGAPEAAVASAGRATTRKAAARKGTSKPRKKASQ
jgi:DNA end-binding protein Ku